MEGESTTCPSPPLSLPPASRFSPGLSNIPIPKEYAYLHIPQVPRPGNTPVTQDNMHWNAEADARILRTLLRYLTAQHIPIPYAEIAAEFGVTPRAVAHRIRKIREESTNSVSEGYEGGEGNRATETATADGEKLPPLLEMPTGKRGRGRTGGRKLPSNKVCEGRVRKLGWDRKEDEKVGQ